MTLKKTDKNQRASQRASAAIREKDSTCQKRRKTSSSCAHRAADRSQESKITGNLQRRRKFFLNFKLLKREITCFSARGIFSHNLQNEKQDNWPNQFVQVVVWAGEPL